MPEFEELSPAELVALQRGGELWQVLDVRESWEVDVARVPGVQTIPMGEVPARLSELEQQRPVAVLCHSGGRSAQVAAWLAGQGFSRVANVTGGIDAWSREVDDGIPRY